MESHQSQMLGMYKVIRPISKGGFAQIYLVEDSSRQQWALKQIHQDLIKQDPDFRQRFERTARIQKELQSLWGNRLSTIGNVSKRQI